MPPQPEGTAASAPVAGPLGHACLSFLVPIFRTSSKFLLTACAFLCFPPHTHMLSQAILESMWLQTGPVLLSLFRAACGEASAGDVGGAKLQLMGNPGPMLFAVFGEAVMQTLIWSGESLGPQHGGVHLSEVLLHTLVWTSLYHCLLLILCQVVHRLGGTAATEHMCQSLRHEFRANLHCTVAGT